jgi:dTDP-4-dehydrorhamnose reductase
MHILILGASGLLGSSLAPALTARGHEVVALQRQPGVRYEDEPTLATAIDAAVDDVRPDCIINLIAWTDVDACEANPARAELLNTRIPAMLGRLRGRNTQPFLLHLSTDQLYDGPGPHDESNPCPPNVYALTKLRGENPIIDAGGCVLRTNFFGRSRAPARHSLSDWIVSSVLQGQVIRVFNDVLFSPLGIESVCEAISLVLDTRCTGVFNLGSNASGLSKADFAQRICENLKLPNSKLIASSIENTATRARRPKDMRMNPHRFEQITGWRAPDIDEEIEHECEKYR